MTYKLDIVLSIDKINTSTNEVIKRTVSVLTMDEWDTILETLGESTGDKQADLFSKLERLEK